MVILLPSTINNYNDKCILKSLTIIKNIDNTYFIYASSSSSSCFWHFVLYVVEQKSHWTHFTQILYWSSFLGTRHISSHYRLPLGLFILRTNNPFFVMLMADWTTFFEEEGFTVPECFLRFYRCQAFCGRISNNLCRWCWKILEIFYNVFKICCLDRNCDGQWFIW